MPAELFYIVKSLNPYENKKSLLPGQSTAQERLGDKTYEGGPIFSKVEVALIILTPGCLASIKSPVGGSKSSLSMLLVRIPRCV